MTNRDARNVRQGADDVIAAADREIDAADRLFRQARLRCPHCGAGRSKVMDSRPNRRHDGIYRRRECLACQYRFSTEEMIRPVSAASHAAAQIVGVQGREKSQ